MPKGIRQKLTKTTQKLRNNICHEYYAKGERIAHISRRQAIATSTVCEIVKRYKREGTTEYKPKGGAKNMKIQDKHSEFLRDIIDDRDEGNILTLEQLKWSQEESMLLYSTSLLTIFSRSLKKLTQVKRNIL